MATKQKYLQKADKYLANICLFCGYLALCSVKFQFIETIYAFPLAYLAVRKYVYFQVIAAICILVGIFSHTEIYGQDSNLIFGLLLFYPCLIFEISKFFSKKNREKKSPKIIALDTIVAILFALLGYALYAKAH